MFRAVENDKMQSQAFSKLVALPVRQRSHHLKRKHRCQLQQSHTAHFRMQRSHEEKKRHAYIQTMLLRNKGDVLIMKRTFQERKDRCRMRRVKFAHVHLQSEGIAVGSEHCRQHLRLKALHSFFYRCPRKAAEWTEVSKTGSKRESKVAQKRLNIDRRLHNRRMHC